VKTLLASRRKIMIHRKKLFFIMKRRRNAPEPFLYLPLKLYNSLTCILRPVEIRSGSFLHQRRQASTGLLTYPLVTCDILNEHLDKAGIERRPFHSLRAICYKLAQAKSWSMRTAAELLGDTLRVAEDHYNAPSRHEMEEIAEEKPLF